jgi:hypothetical protein
LRVAIAFGLTQLPADSLRQRQVSLGALTAWGGLLGSFENDYEQQAIALADLSEIVHLGESLSRHVMEADAERAVKKAAKAAQLLSPPTP